MTNTRLSTLVLDTSVLPKRPKVSDVQEFMANKLKLSMTFVKRIQVHNLKNIVRLGMTSLEVAEQVASNHHMKHFMECDETQVPVPIYVESSAVDVRAFDLPEEISNATIKTYFSKYGEIISIRDEVWRNFFPGVPNGVKLLKMKLVHPIPSIVTIEGESTLIEYKGQPKAGANTKATSNATSATQQSSHSTNAQKKTPSKKAKQQQVNSTSVWPPLPPPPAPTNSNNSNSRKYDGRKRQRSIGRDIDADDTQQQENNSDGSATDNAELDTDDEINKIVRNIEKLQKEAESWKK